MDGVRKILLATETYPPDVNGAAIAVERLAVALAQKGYEVQVIAPGPHFADEEEKRSENLIVHRMKTVSLKPIHPYFRAVWKPGLFKKVEHIIRTFEPDIIHIQSHFLIGRACLRVAAKNNLAIVGTNHFMPENLTEYFPHFLENVIRTWMWKDFSRIYNQLDCVTAPSKAALDMIEALGLKTDLQVISNGMELDRFKKVTVDESIYSRFGLSQAKPIFLFVGRLEQDKNIDVILRAIKQNRETPPCQMVIVGKGKDEEAFKRLARDLQLESCVTFTGKVSDEDLEQLYAIATVYIGSGSAELQGLAVMEAMANGLPVLAANKVALPELVENGMNGFLFELDPHDLALHMQQILSDPLRLQEMGKASSRLIQKHDKKQIVEEYLSLYKKAWLSHRS